MAASTGDIDPTLTGDAAILDRARKRFYRCQQYYEGAYKNSLEDTKFAAQDDRNHYGWPDKIFADRDGKRKPCLTINIVEPHNRLVINESMQNKSSPRVRATGGRATADAAEGMQCLIERTENISAATIAYRKAITDQVNGGFGYLFLETAYIDDKSFDQDIYIKAASDPRAVYLDPDAIERGEPWNSEFGFIFDKTPREKFNREYPKYKDRAGSSTLANDPIWITESHVLVVMYYERAQRKDELIAYPGADGNQVTAHRSQLEKDAGKDLVELIVSQIERGEIEGRFRDVITQDVNWYLIGGDCIIKRGDTPDKRWIGRYIPIIPCYGLMTVIDGKMDCKGHTRAQISPQQMLNYNASGQVQFGALQSKTPYIGPVRAFETNEKEWATANTEDYAYLAYDDFVQEEGEEGRAVAAPTRQEPPQIAPVFMQGMQDAERWDMMVTGQWQASQGQENPRGVESDRTINARQRVGNIATYHFTEHQYDMYRYLGKQLIDIYPKLYDTKRILHIEGEDMSRKIITIDPDMTEAFQRLKKEEDAAEEIVFNPNVGEYDVVSDPGPNYATQRQQAWDAMTQIIAQNEKLTEIFGDLALKNGDFAGAQEMADRMKKYIKHVSPWLFDEGDNPTLAAMQNQINEGIKLNAELVTKLADEKLKVRGRDEKRDIDAFDAESKRMKVLIEAIFEHAVTPAQRAQIEHEIATQTRGHVFNVIEQANAASIAAQNDPETIQ